MVFTYLRRIDTTFTERCLSEWDLPIGDAIKCPVCGNGFFAGVDSEEGFPVNWLIHMPEECNGKEVGKDKFTCPFLLDPILIDAEFSDVSLHSGLLKDFIHVPEETNTLYSEEFLLESIKQYSRMLKLNKTTCNYCGSDYTLSYQFDKDNKFSCNFGCKCLSSKGVPDLSRLALDFMRKYDEKMPERDKRAAFLDSIVSRMPAGSVRINRPREEFPKVS